MLATSGASVAELKYRGRWKSNLMPLRYQHANRDRDAHLAKVTAQFVPLPVIRADTFAPIARPTQIKTKKFEPSDPLTSENDAESSGGETRTLNLAVADEAISDVEKPQENPGHQIFPGIEGDLYDVI